MWTNGSATIDGIEARFEQMLISKDTQLAAVVNLKFKLDWV
jgi:hypothetical protein